MPFVCAGRPTLGDTARLLPALERAGASIVEVGIPFSDPIADGPVIAAAMHAALVAGVTPRAVFDAVASARGSTGLGIVAMVSASIVQRIGVGRFVGDAKRAGFDGFIFPDAPVDEVGPLASAARDAGLTASLLVAPTTPPERAERIVRACTGFVYLLARVGITGEGAGGPGPRLRERVALLRGMTDLPIACGFGIGTAEQVRAVVREAGADAAIVGSALVRRIEDAATAGRDAVAEAASFVAELAGGLGSTDSRDARA